MAKNWLITGRPGIGKTTAILKIVEALRKNGVSVGGVISLEIREKGTRVGFKLVDIETKREGILAHVKVHSNERVGKYGVNLEDLKNIASQAILSAVQNSEVVVCDEIGPMELYSKEFKEAVFKAINSQKIFVGTVHYKARDELIDYARSKANVVELTLTNRNEIPMKIVEQILATIRKV